MQVKIKKLREDAALPVYGTPYAAGADLCAVEGADIPAGKTVLVGTGLAVEIPEGYVGLVCARSGIALKRGLAPANKVGVIDSDYRGELMVAVHNHSLQAQKIECGERMAQLLIVPYIKAEFELCTQLSDTARAAGGFGSTGTK